LPVIYHSNDIMTMLSNSIIFDVNHLDIKEFWLIH
jgi:hypothetical protein